MIDAEDFERIVTEVVNRITRESVDIADVDVITTDEQLKNEHVNTLPGATADGTIVQVALDVFSTPGRQAAAAANSAATSANAATQAAIASKETIEAQFVELKDYANVIIKNCEVATELANTVSDNIGNHKLLVVTEGQYEKLLRGETITIGDKEYSMDPNTIYFGTEEEAT